MLNVTTTDQTHLLDIPENNIVEDNRTVFVQLSSQDAAVNINVMEDEFVIVDNDSKFKPGK